MEDLSLIKPIQVKKKRFLLKRFKKHFVKPREFLLDSYRLAKQIDKSGFKPTWIVTLWRGGATVGLGVQEYFHFKGISTDHIAVRTSHYSGIDKKKKTILVHGLHYIVENANSSDKMLILDDVFDTGKTFEKLLFVLKNKMRKNCPVDIKIGVIYFKPKRNKTKIIPDFYMHESDRWIVFPHELAGLKKEEVKEKDEEVYSIVCGDEEKKEKVEVKEKK